MTERMAVVIPVFQAQADFDRTMATLVRSTMPCDILVIDDGSEPPLDTHGAGVTLIRLTRNQGIVAALNAGLKVAIERGYEFIARIDAGDLAHEKRFAHQLAYLEAHRECMMVGCDVNVIAANGESDFTIAPPRQPGALAKAIKERVWLLHSTVMFRASVFQEVGLYTDEFDAAEDYDLFMRIAAKFPIGVVPETLVICPRTANGISTVKARTQLISRLRIQARHFDRTSPSAYLGVLRTLAALMLSQRLKMWMKSRFVYRRISRDRARLKDLTRLTERAQ
jgi:glycosyltransferase involved in cell wall biosynthesis